MKVYPDTKIYIVCPANFHTGGAELLHQLCSQLIQFGIDAYMVYFPFNVNFNVNDPVDEFYKKYHIKYTYNIIDDERNIFVVYEGVTHYLYNYKKIRRVLWWLSADNYLHCLAVFIENLTHIILNNSLPKIFYFDDRDTDIEHWVQCEYARQFVELNGIPKERIFFVEDYMNQAFLKRAKSINLSKKENIVAFNPKKGMEITTQIIKCAPDINWQPIQNMTPEQVQNLLAKCKVYIDFGNHPGKDRIPREAALSGCVVITGKRGSAANDIDINIPPEFKFDEKISQATDIIKKIRDVFENFLIEHAKQSDYRDRILDDKPRFFNEVAKALEYAPPPPILINTLQ